MKAFIAWNCMAKAKHMSSRSAVGANAPGVLRFWNDEQGGLHLVLFALLGVAAASFLWVVAWNWLLHGHSLSRAKPLLDHAVRAASLQLDPGEAALGRLVWDEAAGRDHFLRYLRLNFKLNGDLTPQPGSPLESAPVVHRLEFVTHSTYPYELVRSVTVREGGNLQTTRNVRVTIYGPSVVAVVELERSLLGLGRKEPIVLSSVASVRFR
ncbi:hypothetical protein [Paenibacillus validus]|nr:hypothetical protein [Paenibacillus validus]